MFLGGVMQTTGNRPPGTVSPKGMDGGGLARFAKRYGVAYKPNPHFPMMTLMVQRAAMGLLGVTSNTMSPPYSTLHGGIRRTSPTRQCWRKC